MLWLLYFSAFDLDWLVGLYCLHSHLFLKVTALALRHVLDVYYFEFNGLRLLVIEIDVRVFRARAAISCAELLSFGSLHFLFGCLSCVT